MDDLGTSLAHLKERQDEDRTLLHEINENVLRLMEKFDRMHDDQVEAEEEAEKVEARVNALESWRRDVDARTGLWTYIREGAWAVLVAIGSIVVWAGYFNKSH